MNWQINSGRPVYMQLVEQIQRAVLNGEYAPGSKFPAVRELAADDGVNPNTMQRALQVLEQSGLLCVENRTAGRVVTQDEALIERLCSDEARNAAERFCREMVQMGKTAEETVDLIHECEKKGIFDGE